MSSVITLSVPGVFCGGCRQAIRGAVGTLPGVSPVRVDLEGKTVTAAYERATALSGIVSAVEDAGYAIAGYRVGHQTERSVA
ncbi:heavy-metal-associated domain-containing protein [Streptomyces sp. NPDC006385]|uniref:heavy-metal-associated domain-containing protein n=1 Tax=Streptomyces sp. NPDC006385 TaxID=3156761 RepID=UPI0033A04584